MATIINTIQKKYEVVLNPAARKINVIISPLGKQGPQGSPGLNYIDIELVVETDNQTHFNIFSEPTLSNLFINDSTYFLEKSYHIQNIEGNWRLIWLQEFPLKTNDLLIFRKL